MKKNKEPEEGSGSKKVIEVSRYMMQIYSQPNNILHHGYNNNNNIAFFPKQVGVGYR